LLPGPLLPAEIGEAALDVFLKGTQDESCAPGLLCVKAEVAEAVGRGEKATYQELCSIRREKGSDIAIKPRKIVYTPEVDAVIIRMHNSNRSYMEIGKATGRTKWAIKARVNYLRKHGLIAKDNRKDR
jgi:hypothetical protein